MRFRNGIGGSTVIDDTHRRWLLILLAFVLIATTVLVTAQPANAEYENGDEVTVCEDEMEEYEEYEYENGEEECDGDFSFGDPFGDEDWTATFECDGCIAAIVVRDPDEFDASENNLADIEVILEDDAFFSLVVTATGKGTPPGRAVVENDDTGVNLPKCTGKNMKAEKVQCVKIKRVKGAHTQYTVRFDTDPRFKFR